MAKELIINASLPEVRIALLEEGRIQELLIERQSEKGIVGNIYKGKVTRVLPGMQAAFVDIGLDKAAFLYVDDIYVHPKVMGEENEIEEEGREEGVDGNGDDGVSVQGGEGSSDGTENQLEGNVEGSEALHAGEASDAGDVADETESGSSEENLEASSEESSDDAMEAAYSAEASAEVETSGAEESTEAETLEMNDDSADDLADDEDAGDDESGDEMGDELEGAEGQPVMEMAPPAQEPVLDAEGNAVLDENGQPVMKDVAPAAGTPGGFKAPAGGMGGMAQQARGPRRNRNRNRRRGKGKGGQHQFAGGESNVDPNIIPDTFTEHVDDQGNVQSDRSAVAGEEVRVGSSPSGQKGVQRQRPEFREQRNRDRRIKSKSLRPRAQANIADLLSEGQEVIVQVAKDPIATKGARLTCHVSLPGRHLVCMPSIDHVGVSRRIERDDERRRLRDFVEKNRPKKMGFIVRTASGGKDPESWIKQDIDYLSKLWKGIRTRADNTPPASLVYEDLNSVLRAIRDWVNEDIQKIVVDSRYHYNELLEFAERFMPSLEGKIELYHGDIPIFDAYGLSAELNRSLERKVWLKSGGSIVIDQAEALVAIDVNTGRFVGKTNLEATILKTNLEAAEEVAYQMRLRNCGGIIIVDFIDMERDENKMRVYRALDEALKKDRARPTIQKISELGLVEMTRKRTRDTLVRALCEPCTHCEGKGYTKGPRTVAYEILREIERLGVDREAKKILVSAHESVVDLLAIDLREALDTLEKRYNKQVYIQTILDFHNEQFEVVTDRMQGKKQAGDIARQLRIERDRSERKEKQQKRQREDREREQDDEGGGDSPREARSGDGGGDQGQGRGGRNRDRNRGGGRDRNRDRNGRDQNQNREQNSEQPAAQAAAPVVRPSGSFVVRPKPEVDPNAPVEANTAPVADGLPMDEGDDTQPQLNQQNQNRPPRQQPSREEMEGMDEDQLAYLRAQAAQDAAIASLSQDGANPKSQPHQNRGRQNQNNRNNRGGHGGHGSGGQNRNQNNRNNRGQGGGGGQNRNQKYRPRPQGNGMGNEAGNSVQAAPTVEVQASYSAPDYEVSSKPSDDGSNS